MHLGSFHDVSSLRAIHMKPVEQPSVRCRLMRTGLYTLTKGNGGTLELTPDEAESVVAQLQLLMMQQLLMVKNDG